MTISGLVLDLSTVVRSDNGKPHDGIQELIAAAEKFGLKIVVTSNHGSPYAVQALKKAGLSPALCIGPDSTGGFKKGSPHFNGHIAKTLGCDNNQLIYVGDDDKTDFPSCVNSGVLYFRAEWSNPNTTYGLTADTPASVRRFIARHLLERVNWYWRLEAEDSLGRVVDARSLIPPAPNSAASPDIAVLKRGEVYRIGRLDYFRFLFRRLIAGLYLDGRLADYDVWTFYPGHEGGPKGARYQTAIEPATKIFRGLYLSDLLVRHVIAQKSVWVRRQGGTPLFTTQTNSMHLNDAYRKKVAGKRILVLDDVCTSGNAFECARNMLLLGGAARVDCVSVVRYPRGYEIRVPKNGVVWDPWKPVTLKESDFHTTVANGVTDSTAEQQHARLARLVL